VLFRSGQSSPVWVWWTNLKIPQPTGVTMSSKNTGLDLESLSATLCANPELYDLLVQFKSGAVALDEDGELYIPEPVDVAGFTRKFVQGLPPGTKCGIKQPKSHAVYYALPVELQGNNKGTPSEVRLHDNTRKIVKSTLDKMVEDGELIRVHKKTGLPWEGGNPIGMCFMTASRPEPVVELETSQDEELDD
jgi:hypothetical protein